MRPTAAAISARALVLKHEGDASGASREAAIARTYWKDADSDLSELKLLSEVAASTSMSSREARESLLRPDGGSP